MPILIPICNQLKIIMNIYKLFHFLDENDNATKIFNPSFLYMYSVTKNQFKTRYDEVVFEIFKEFLFNI